MRNLLRQILLGLILVATTWNLSSAQVALIGPQLNVDNGDIISVDIKVTDFVNIVSMQFTMQWDSAVVNFVGLDNFGLPDLGAGNFGTLSASGGLSAIAWIDDSLAGITLPDSSTLFTINFEVIGQANEVTPVAFTSDLAIIELGNADGQILDVELSHGLISINGINSNTTLNETKDFSLDQNFPNPFQKETYIPFHLTRSADVNLGIYNNYGQVIYEESGFFTEGEHLIKLDSDVFPSSGRYTIKLFTSNFLATKQLIFLN